MTQQTETLDWFALLLGEPEQPKPVTVDKPFIKRHFYRCVDCLSVVASEVKIEYRVPTSNYPRYGQCGACGGAMEYMGVTQRDRLVKTGYECPCDGRCTNAVGPSCDCKCGGANHGSNSVVEVTYDAGSVPSFHTPANAASKAEEYRRLVEVARTVIYARYGTWFERKRAGEYLGSTGFSLYREGCDLLQELARIKGLRVYGTRNKRLIALAQKSGAPQ